MTRILVAIGETKHAEDFMTILLPRGFEVYIVEKKTELFDIARQRTPDVIIFDSDVEEYQKLVGLQEIRKDPSLGRAHIILLSKESGLDFVKTTMKLGVVGYLYKPISSEQLEEQVLKLLETITINDNRREYVRVKPASFENSRAELFISGSEGISGDVLDISLGGVALRLSNGMRLSEIQIGILYDNMRLSLEGMPLIQVSCTAVLAKGDVVAFKFSKLNDTPLKVLCRYIHNKLMNMDTDDPSSKYMKMV